MNTFHSINTEYLRPSRTIETVMVSNEISNKLFFIYNYEGNSFRIFENHLDLINFFQNMTGNYLHFNSDGEVDLFLEIVKFWS